VRPTASNDGPDRSRALIVGAAGGIGRAAAAALAEHGFDVIVADSRADALASVPAIARVRVDITDGESVDDVVGNVGDIDVLVNAAGIGFWSPVEIVSIAEVARLFDINFFGAVRLTQAVLPGMRRRRGGLIVHVSSVGARVVNPANGYYAASKCALEAVCEALRIEVRHLGIRVVVVEPGAVDTGFGKRRYVAQSGDPVYADLMATMSAAFDGVDKAAPSTVGDAIARIATTPDPDFRWAVPEDLAADITARLAMSDRQYEELARLRFDLPTTQPLVAPS
jgi:NAD(P)-dependent dehydrogenase (short-subunit alcohol dehydrogenase family)